MTTKFMIPPWIVEALGGEQKARATAKYYMDEVKRAGFGPQQGIPAVLECLTAEAEARQLAALMPNGKGH